jgi:hypothetical protein
MSPADVSSRAPIFRAVLPSARAIGAARRRCSESIAGIVIVSREISDELKVALRDLPDVELFEYRLSMTPRRVRRLHMTCAGCRPHGSDIAVSNIAD